MGTSRNRRSPVHIRWSMVDSALATGRPRGISRELFIASRQDGWAAALASPVIAAYAITAAESASRMPQLFADAESPTQAIRRLADDARATSLRTLSSFEDADVAPAMAERSLVRIVAAVVQSAGSPVHTLSTRQATTAWQGRNPSAGTLCAEFLRQRIGALTRHLVCRDAPKHVQTLGGARAISALAEQVSRIAAEVSEPGCRLLESEAPLAARTPLRRGTPIERAARVPKPRAKTSPEEREARRIVYARSRGFCELCGRPAESWSHRRSAGQGGPWNAANGLHLCGDGVRGCHGWLEANPLAADAGGWRLVHRDPDPGETPVWLPGRGWVYLTLDGCHVPAPSVPSPTVFPWSKR